MKNYESSKRKHNFLKQINFVEHVSQSHSILSIFYKHFYFDITDSSVH